MIVACFVGLTQLMYGINVQRRELQLGADTQIDERVPPEYALLAQLGSFRGVAVNVLWYQLEQQKQAGKFFEANQLSRLITKLQPRFPQVWGFMGWNMAYNISVKTSTPEERWDWVNKGIDLLRDEGIPNNPNAIRVYRELGWILFHKVGGSTDDMHHYYKAQLAKEWHPIVGNDIEQLTPEAYKKHWQQLGEITRNYFVGGQTGALVGEPSTETLIRFRTDFPQTAPLVTELKSLGFDLSPATLKAWGTLQMFRDYYPWPTVERLENDVLPDASRRLIPLLKQIEAERTAILRAPSVEARDKAIKAAKLMPGVPPLLAFLRAQTLIEEYHMDPRFMVELIERFGPIDWRSAGGQSLYWYARGVDQAYDLRDRTKYDQINTDRGIIHSLQWLFRFGTLAFDPLGGQQRQGVVTGDPNIDFVDSYELAVEQARERGMQVDWGVGRDTTYQAGHENFLHDAIRAAYFYDADRNKTKAHELYARVKKLYGKDSEGQVQTAYQDEYQLPLARFVTTTWVQDSGMEQVPRLAIEGLLYQGFRTGVALNRPEQWLRAVEIARNIHQNAQEKREGGGNPNAFEDRRALPDFETFQLNAFVNFLSDPRIPLLYRSRVWINMYSIEPRMLPFVYDRVIPRLRQQADMSGLDPGFLFPDPPNLAEFRESQRQAAQQAPPQGPAQNPAQNVERQ